MCEAPEMFEIPATHRSSLRETTEADFLSSKQLQLAQQSGFVYRIISFNVIDRPGIACIEVLKDRKTGKKGIKLVETHRLTGFNNYQLESI